MSWVSSGECRNSCWAAAEVLAGTEEIDPEKVRGRNSGLAVATEMCRRCRDWNDRDQRDHAPSDHARRATNRSSPALDRRHIHSAGYAKAPARMAGRIRLRPADSNLNWGNRNRLLANRHTLVHRRGEHHRLEQRPRRRADGLGRSDSLMRDSHRGNRCDSRARHGTARHCNERAAGGVRGRGDHDRSTELMPSLPLQRSRQQGVR